MDPEFALFHLQRALWDPVDPRRLGSLAPALRTRVNGEWYRFAGPATLARFRRDPVAWCGVLRDPVSGVRFRPTRRSPRAGTRDGPYFFAGDSTRAQFLRDPGRYLVFRVD